MLPARDVRDGRAGQLVMQVAPANKTFQQRRLRGYSLFHAGVLRFHAADEQARRITRLCRVCAWD
jgi:hypothetical protein